MNTSPIFEETQSFTSEAVSRTIVFTAVLLLACAGISLFVAQKKAVIVMLPKGFRWIRHSGCTEFSIKSRIICCV